MSSAFHNSCLPSPVTMRLLSPSHRLSQYAGFYVMFHVASEMSCPNLFDAFSFACLELFLLDECTSLRWFFCNWWEIRNPLPKDSWNMSTQKVTLLHVSWYLDFQVLLAHCESNLSRNTSSLWSPGTHLMQLNFVALQRVSRYLEHKEWRQLLDLHMKPPSFVHVNLENFWRRPQSGLPMHRYECYVDGSNLRGISTHRASSAPRSPIAPSWFGWPWSRWTSRWNRKFRQMQGSSVLKSRPKVRPKQLTRIKNEVTNTLGAWVPKQSLSVRSSSMS